MKRMLFNATHPEEMRVAVVDGHKLLDLDVELSAKEHRKSNIYKGIVTRIEPSLEAAFIDYGVERHGFLPFKAVSRVCFPEELVNTGRRIKAQDLLFEGQELIVQVDKDERGSKGAALTTFISLAGRYLVLMPNNPRGGGISRRVEGGHRIELKEVLDSLVIPSGMSLIARTAAIGKTQEELEWDLQYLLRLWEAVGQAGLPQFQLEDGQVVSSEDPSFDASLRGAQRINAQPYLIYEDSSIVIRAIRDCFHPDIEEILVDSQDLYEQACQFMVHVMPQNIDKVKRYSDSTPLFSRFQIEHQIETAYSRVVVLPSGGSIIVDHAEALVAIDVNSAKATKGADIEETALKTNLEAADEIGRQLRLRDLGGLIVIDFIDMENPRNQREVESRLKEALRYDRARVQMGKISRFGLLELSRQRLCPSLGEGSHTVCPRCAGTGFIRNTESSALHVLRILHEEVMDSEGGAICIHVPVPVAVYLLNEKRKEVSSIESRFGRSVIIIPNPQLETPAYNLVRVRQSLMDSNIPSYQMTAGDSDSAASAQEGGRINTKMQPIVKNATSINASASALALSLPRGRSEDSGFLSRIVSWWKNRNDTSELADDFVLSHLSADSEILLPEPETSVRRPANDVSSSQRQGYNNNRRSRGTGGGRRDRWGGRGGEQSASLDPVAASTPPIGGVNNERSLVGNEEEPIVNLRQSRKPTTNHRRKVLVNNPAPDHSNSNELSAPSLSDTPPVSRSNETRSSSTRGRSSPSIVAAYNVETKLEQDVPTTDGPSPVSHNIHSRPRRDRRSPARSNGDSQNRSSSRKRDDELTPDFNSRYNHVSSDISSHSSSGDGVVRLTLPVCYEETSPSIAVSEDKSMRKDICFEVEPKKENNPTSLSISDVSPPLSPNNAQLHSIKEETLNASSMCCETISHLSPADAGLVFVETASHSADKKPQDVKRQSRSPRRRRERAKPANHSSNDLNDGSAAPLMQVETKY